jgi:hypothetical protein
MNRTQYEIAPGVVLDARRAVFLARESVLAVADLHFGYAWTHRARGQMLPVTARETALERLRRLLSEYQPHTLVLVGDIVHGVVPVVELREELRRFVEALRAHAEVVLLAGNHDRRLAEFLGEELPVEWRAGAHLLRHGDGQDGALAAAHLAAVRAAGGMVIIGHEHPSVTLGDGVAHHARVPCFLAGDGLLVLPAFSEWAAGSNIRAGEFLSPYLPAAGAHRVVAILAGKLLPVPGGSRAR